MEAKKILEKLSIENCPVGMGGCRNQGSSYDCCEYDITVFDEKKQKESFRQWLKTSQQNLVPSIISGKSTPWGALFRDILDIFPSIRRCIVIVVNRKMRTIS